MKVLYFSNNASGHNQRFLEKLSQAGVKVWFLNPAADRLEPSWLPEGVHWIRARKSVAQGLGPTAYAGFLAEFERCLAEVNPDVVHAGPIPTCGYVAALSSFHPWLLTSWGSDLLLDAQRNSGWREGTRVAFSSADAFFCDCNTVREAAKQFADIPDSRVVQFPWGIRAGEFGPSGSLPAREKFEREPGTHVFLSTRSWEPLYGLKTLLEAFLLAYRREPASRLLLMGNGSEAPRVGEFIRAHGLHSVIRTPGAFPQEEMPRWFRAADSYVSCAVADGASVSLLEAMATGLPVVVTDNASNREWVAEGENGWLASAGSAEQFAERFLRAAHLGSQERALVSDRNRTIIQQRADWDRNFPRLLQMYERITGMRVDA